MPCITTTYPHGTINGDSQSVVLLPQADTCRNICVTYTTSILSDEQGSINECLAWISGNVPYNTFNYGEADMICVDCYAVCTTGESSAGCNWKAGIVHCCIDDTVVINGFSLDCDTAVTNGVIVNAYL